MMTRTSAADYHADGNPHEQRGHGLGFDEDPRISRSARRATIGSSPLDLGGAARIVDPIISGFNTGEISGVNFQRLPPHALVKRLE